MGWKISGVKIGDIYFYYSPYKKENSIFIVRKINNEESLLYYDIYNFDGKFKELTDDFIGSLKSINIDKCDTISNFLNDIIFYKNIREIRINIYRNKIIK